MEPTKSHLNPFIDYIADDKSEEKLRDLFDFYDADGNGMIQRQELIDVLSLCAHEIGLEVDSYLEQLADAVFSNANLNQSGSITFESLKDVLKKRPNLTSELSLARGLHQTNQSDGAGGGCNGDANQRNQRRNQNNACQGARNYLANSWESVVTYLAHYMPIFNKLRWEYVRNNLVRVNFIITINALSLLLIIGRIVTYWDSGAFVVIARCAGQCLNFFCSIIVLLVCRRSISLLRSHGYSRYLPLDDHVYFHKMIGIMIGFYSLLHTAGHLANFYLLSSGADSSVSYGEYLFSTRLGLGWLGGCASLTGWLLLIIIAIMSLAQPFSRSLGKFELFYYSHLLYIPFWILLFVHAPRFWAWFLAPFVVFSLETLIRLKNFASSFLSAEHTTIIKAVPLPSNVVHLVIKKPAHFEYKPGDWIYVLIPQIAKYEWHPFTISSAPEQEGVIWLHIRAVGEWTRCLRSYFEGLEHRNHLRRFIRSGQFSMSMDQFTTAQGGPLQSGDVSSSDSTRYLGTNRHIRDKLSSFKRKCTPLAPIPEAEGSCETVETSTTSLSLQTADSTASRRYGNTQAASSNRLMSSTLQQQHQLQQQPSTSSSTSSSSSSSLSSSSSACSSSFATSAESALDMSSGSASGGASTTSQRLVKLPNIKIYIDGPYGSPSSQIFRAEHAVLIATGIGVTPFASILQSIVHHYEKRRQKCPSCAYEFSDTRPPIVCKLRKVDFVWINRDQKSFEWFIKLLAELELAQSHLPPNERFLDIHIHLTAMELAKTKSIGLQLALYLVHEKNKKDLVTGLRTRTKAGRPNWNELFQNIQDQKRGKVSVFFCGQPQLGRILHRQCDSFGFKFRKEIF